MADWIAGLVARLPEEDGECRSCSELNLPRDPRTIKGLTVVGGERLDMYKQLNVTRVQTRRVCLFARLRMLLVKDLRGYAAWQAAWQSTRQGQISGRLQAIAFDSTSIVVSCRSSMKRRMHEGMRSHGNLGLHKSSIGGTSLPLCAICRCR